MGSVERSGGASWTGGPLVAATLAAAALLAGCGSGGDTATAPTTAASATAGAPAPTEADPTSTTATPGGVSGAATLGSAAGRERDSGSTARGSTDTTDTTDEVDATGATGTEVAPDVTWSLSAIDYRGEDGLEITYDCPPDGVLGSVWGTGTYTDDSSVCTAAVHFGLITRAGGGSVVIEISPGLEAYDASTANGVTSSAYGPWNGSFTFTVR